MKTLKRLFKVLVNGYLDSYKESANIMYGHLYK